MSGQSRRRFLQASLLGGLALAGAGSLKLRADTPPTESSGELGEYGDYLRQRGENADAAPDRPADEWSPTEDNILGPFYRQGAPFRGKITPPMTAGDVLLIRGRVWGFDTRKPLTSAVLDIWQANDAGRYDNDDPRNPPKPNVFTNRARLVVDAQGYYEYESIHPGAYKIGQNTWRPPHIHYLVRCKGYQRLITQLYFKGDPHQADDPWIKDSLTIDLNEVKTERGVYREGTFDIVLAPADD